MPVTAKTQWVGLLGWPLNHSISPAIFNAAFQETGLDWSYLPLPTPPQGLPEAIAGLRALGFRGANVTHPHKERVLEWTDELSPDARAIGAVNVLVVDDWRIRGANTDAPGFLKSLREVGVELAAARAVILGAGGAARAVAYALAQEGAQSVVLANRTLARAEVAADHLGRQFPNTRFSPRPLEPHLLQSEIERCHLLVHATPVGQTPRDGDCILPAGVSIPPSLLVCDLVYRPQETALLRRARAAGARILPGLPMLVYQGGESLRLWTDLEPPWETMFQAAYQALGLAAVKGG